MTLCLAKDLSVTIGGTQVLSELNLSLNRGEVVAIQGESGSGKSTLLHTLAGLIEPTSGEVWLDGVRIDSMPDGQRSVVRLRNIGCVLQTGDLLPELTIAENVSLPLRMAIRVGRREIAARVEEALAEVGIGDLGARSLSEVSGGQLQRAAIARAVIHAPRLILADEPTGSLDSGNARQVISLLIDIAHKRTDAGLVIVTHDHEVARRCDRALHLRAGTLLSGELQTETRIA